MESSSLKWRHRGDRPPSPLLAEDGRLSMEREGASAETGTGAVATHEAKPPTELGKTGKRPTTLLRSQGLARRLRQRGPRGRWRGSSAPGLSCRWRSEKRSQQRKHFERKRPVLVSEPTGRRRRGDGGRVGGPPLPATAPPAAAPPATRSAPKGPREALASGWSQTVSPWPIQEERRGGRATSRAGSGAGSYGTTSWDPATARPVRGPRGRVLLHGSGEQTCQAQEAPSQRQILILLGRCSRGARWGRLAGRRGRGGRGGPHMPCLGSLSKISIDNTLQSRTLLSAEKQDCSI